jgi:hypothetical protein
MFGKSARWGELPGKLTDSFPYKLVAVHSLHFPMITI